MRAQFERVLARYGQRVLLTRADGGERAVRAFVQPVLKRREDLPVTATPLGAVSGGRWLYIGSGRQPVAPGDQVDCGGLRLVVQEARAVCWEDKPCYYWAMLRFRKEAAV